MDRESQNKIETRSEPVTVRTFRDYIGANIAKTKLESEGIRCFLANDTIITMNWLYSDAFGGVKLQVSGADVPTALHVLSAEPVGLELLDPQSFDAGPLKCPKCACSNVYEDRVPRRLFFGIWLLTAWPFGTLAGGGLLPLFLLSFPLTRFLFKTTYICADCGLSWTGTATVWQKCGGQRVGSDKYCRNCGVEE